MSGQRVIVTAASRGIGRATVERFVADGAVVAAIARRADGLADLVEAVGSGRVIPIQADLAEAGAAETAIRSAADRLGGVDVLVNNVGGWGDVDGATGPLLNTTHEAYAHMMDLNIRATLFGTIEAARLMIDQRSGGAICCTVSVDGLFPAPGEGLYGAGKAAVINLVGTLAYELGEYGIRVNAVAPAIVETSLTAPWLANAEARLDCASLYPLQRIGQPDDVANAITYLCSPEAGWISGITLPVNGGQQGTGNAFRWVRARNPVPPHLKI